MDLGLQNPVAAAPRCFHGLLVLRAGLVVLSVDLVQLRREHQSRSQTTRVALTPAYELLQTIPGIKSARLVSKLISPFSLKAEAIDMKVTVGGP